ncbi:MAG: methionine synthase [Elusimicrobia bacterium]|nr:methionine synthase [Candidatus Obscuribacterium magneticum]
MKKKKKAKPLNAGRRKLAALGIELPLFPTTSVGSLPLPQELREMRFKVTRGVQSAAELERREKLALEHWIHAQERLGLDVLVDGELDRGDMVSFFAQKIEGFQPGGTVRVYGNRYYRKPIIGGKLEWRGPLTAARWHYAQRLTHRPMKAVLTGPYTLVDWSFNEYYTSREAALEALVKIMRNEIRALTELGAKIIQIDEPALASHPKDFPLFLNALKELVSSFKAYFILHHCYGDLSPLWEKMERLPVDNFSFEATNSLKILRPLLKKHPTKKDISFGVIDVHSHIVETPRQVGDAIRAARQVLPADQLWISPDCGLKTRTMEEATEKLEVMVNVVEKWREKTRAKFIH